MVKRTVNIMHIHCPGLDTPLEEHARTMIDLYQAGKFKRVRTLALP